LEQASIVNAEICYTVLLSLKASKLDKSANLRLILSYRLLGKSLKYDVCDHQHGQSHEMNEERRGTLCTQSEIKRQTMNRVLWSNDCLKPTDTWPAISKVNKIYLNMTRKKIC
jgi:hypothetical protein